MALYGGELLAGRPLEVNAGFAAWLELERENLRARSRPGALIAEELESRATAGRRRVEPLMQSDTLAEDVLRTCVTPGRPAAAGS